MSRSGAPPLGLLAAEGSRAAAELGLYLAARPALACAPRGDGHPVLVLPGLGAGDLSTRVLRRYLRTRGYHVHRWRLGPQRRADAADRRRDDRAVAASGGAARACGEHRRVEPRRYLRP